MRVPNNKEEVPFAHYVERFLSLDPQEAAARCGLPFDGTWFDLTLLGAPYRVRWPEYALQARTPASLPAQTFLLRYLLEGRAVPSTGQWKTFREMPWGEMYIRPYTGRCLNRAAFAFGTKLPRFIAACRRMGAVELPNADAAFQLPFLGPYAMRILIWQGDDEFAPSAQLLYSDNFAQGFAAEDRVVAGDLLITAIQKQMNEVDAS